MAEILKRKHDRLHVRAVNLPVTDDRILGSGIDVMNLPEGHLACAKCQSPFFECWVFLSLSRIEMGCIRCGYSNRLNFPYDISLSMFKKMGRFTCAKHPDKGIVLIHNVDVISLGCQCCWREMRIPLKTKSNLVFAND